MVCSLSIEVSVDKDRDVQIRSVSFVAGLPGRKWVTINIMSAHFTVRTPKLRI